MVCPIANFDEVLCIYLKNNFHSFSSFNNVFSDSPPAPTIEVEILFDKFKTLLLPYNLFHKKIGTESVTFGGAKI